MKKKTIDSCREPYQTPATEVLTEVPCDVFCASYGENGDVISDNDTEYDW